ncbi:phage antirepressor KilAC domain-containing protein [Arcobacter sp.]|uniref:phage antirepressor KilAC domain-containing protein n=1 Tax=unclassified Arcobacter TaxID=2593671 RepID=UPI003B0000E5|eukprot:TRINITY_DN50612_c0_g1_i1.p2 TRINITY_DN50612_c0_g1~~TRINITY_DN50612_c0_g1_i1.p2  ORF type:complete len:250 (-),score=-50.18 TRINITY_DN50612_c0_g1_i1:799-1548(-)
MSVVEKKELIKILKTDIGTEELNSVNSRELYEYLGISTDYNTWIKRAIDKYDFVESEDYILLKNGENGSNPKIDYIVTMDMAKELCMVSNTPKGKQVRRYFIEVEKEANKPLTVEQLLLENAKMIDNLQNKVVILEHKVEKNEPKVLFADSVSQSYTSILIGEFAKAISSDDFKIGQNKLFKWLRHNKYLISSGTRFNQPLQQHIDNGYFEVIERTINNPDGSTRITVTTKITGKGQVALTKKIRDSFY